MTTSDSTLKVLTWPVHGNYMYYLSRSVLEPRNGTRVVFYAPTRENPGNGYGGRDCGMPLPENVIDVPAEEVPDLELDCVLYQSAEHYQQADSVLSDRQRRVLPRLYIEHDPPRQSPTDTRHWAAEDREVWLYHCTHYNALMWDSGEARTGVIEHGVTVPNPRGWTGETQKGVVAINNLATRGRRLGPDVFQEVAKQVPLDLMGLNAQLLGGPGPIDGIELPRWMAQYRFFLNPIRHTSLGLSLIEAMMVGLPPVGLATTELPTVIDHGKTGYLSCKIDELVSYMQRFLRDRDHAAEIGAAAAEMALERFSLERFGTDWTAAFERALM